MSRIVTRRRRRQPSRLSFYLIGGLIVAAHGAAISQIGNPWWLRVIAFSALALGAFAARHSDTATARLARELVADSRRRHPRPAGAHRPTPGERAEVGWAEG